jgi:serine/threonine-protein kinase
VRVTDVPTQPAGVTTLQGLGAVRRQMRVPTSFGVQVYGEDGTLLGDALVTDVSLSGAFVRSALVLPLFSRVRIMGSSSAGRLDLIGELVRLEISDTVHRGFGVRFLDPMPADQQKVLEALQRKLPLTDTAGDREGEGVLRQFEPRISSGHYVLLGVPKDSSTRRIRDVCERLAEEMSAKRFTNLTPGQVKRFAALRTRLTEAEEDLIDPHRRALYDAVTGNVLGVLRCITEGLDLELLEELRVKFLKARPEAEERIREPLALAEAAERSGDLDAAMQALADALCIDPLNLALHRRAGALRGRTKS